MDYIIRYGFNFNTFIKNTHDVTSLSTLTVSEFYKYLAVNLNLEPAHKKSDNFKKIQSEINRYYIEKQITQVIIIDEANYINNGILNDLKMLKCYLTLIWTQKTVLLVLFVGLPQFNNT